MNDIREEGSICPDIFWSVNLTWYSAVPDFTQCFQQAILVSTPCLILCVVGIINIIINSKRPLQVGTPWTALYIIKMVLNIVLILISIAEISITSYQKSLAWNVPNIMILGSCAKIVSYIVALFILRQNKRLGMETSTILSIFWFVFSICGAIRYRSSFVKVYDGTYVSTSVDEYVLDMIHFPLVVCQFFFSIISDSVNDLSKKRSFIDDSSFFSLLTFFWFYKYIYKSTKELLTVKDFQPLDQKLQANYVWKKFHAHWKKIFLKRPNDRNESDGKKKISPLRMAWILTKSVWPYFLLGCFFQLVYDFLIFVPPFILDKILTFVSSNDHAWKGYLYCGALFLSNLMSHHCFTYMLYFSSFYAGQIKSTVISAIYRKAIKLSCSAKRDYTTGEIVNLMSVDVENMYILAFYSNFMFGAPIKLCITLVLLWQYLGASCLAGAIVLIVMMMIGYFFAKRTQTVQEKQMETKDLRLKHMNEILNGIKVLKLYAWEIPFSEKIAKIRQQEVTYIRMFQLLFAGTIFVWNCGPLFVGIACFVTYVLVDETHSLDAVTLFVSMNLLNILRHAVMEIPEVVAKIVQTWVSLSRVIKFLLSEEADENAVGNCCAFGHAVSVKNGVFSWSNDGEPTLANIDIQVPCGSLVAVIGPVGSGKSSLLSAILGEMNKKSGQIDVNGSISYIPQQAWILNRSLKENVLFVSPNNRRKYDAALDGCCLRPDLEVLPGGDKTEIGEKGVNLSGGQKQRVSLARAIYHDADIYLFDDPLSAVDSHVGKHIFDHVISKTGLLKNKTRILVTHNINVLPETDFIVTMKDGKIHETGTYSALMKCGNVFSEFIAEHSTIKDEDKKGLESGDELMPTAEQSINSNFPFLRSLSVDSAGSALSAKLMDEEYMEVGQVKRTVYLNYGKHLGVFLLCGALFLSLSAEIFEIGIDVWLSQWSSDPQLDDGSQDIPQRNHRITIYAIMGLCKAAIKICSSVCFAFGAARASRLYHKEMLHSVLRAPMSFFDTTPLGRIVNRFGRDISDVDTEIVMHLDGCIACFFYSIGTFIVISASTPLFLAFLIPIGVVYFLVQKCYLITSRQLKRLTSTTRSPVCSHFTESINGVSSIRAYKVQDYFIRTVNEKLDTNIMCQMYSEMSTRWLEFNLSFIGDTVILIAAVLALESRDVLDAGAVGLSITFAMSITEVLTWMVYSFTELENKCVSVERIDEYVRIPPEAPWTISEHDPPSSWPAKGRLEFKDYSTRYRKGLDLVIKNINLNIKENEKVGIVGRTGAGKSSFALALFRIIEPAAGAAFIDDVDVSEIGLHQLRSKLTIIPQDPVLFTGPLRMNLDPKSNHSDAELWSSLESAHLKTFVSSLSDGLDFEIAEGGENLSVGQRQLICLARALLKQAKILILDEATAAVDMDTDSLIQATIRSQFKNYTVITIAHRLNTIMDYDKIVVMDAGKIAEVGSPSELLERPDSQFYNMAQDAGLL